MSLDVCRRGGCNRKPGCLWFISQLPSAALVMGWVEHAAPASSPATTQAREGLGAPHPGQAVGGERGWLAGCSAHGAGSELGLCFQSPESSTAMEQLK